MIRLNFEQCSAEWFAARLGIPTASNFSKILTPGGKLSSQCAGYGYKLIAEQLLGISLDAESSDFMQRGSLMEKHAVDYYELQKECDTEKVGFILRDDKRVGCSPDRLVGDNGMLEIKVPSAPVHIGYLLDTEGIGYKSQVQGQLWLAEREWSDTLSYHPDLPPALVRQSRDEAFIKLLANGVDQFLSFVDESKLKLQRFGLFADERIPDLKIA